jgi:hypothetical protein
MIWRREYGPCDLDDALLVFRVMDGEVEILRILYGGRDLDRLFTQGQSL